PVIKTVARSPGFPPDHAAVIGSHRTLKPDFAQAAEHLIQIDAAVAGWMGGLMKLPCTRHLDVAAMREVDASHSTDAAHHGCQVVRRIGPQRARTEGDSVRRTIHQ